MLLNTSVMHTPCLQQCCQLLKPGLLECCKAVVKKLTLIHFYEISNNRLEIDVLSALQFQK